VLVEKSLEFRKLQGFGRNQEDGLWRKALGISMRKTPAEPDEVLFLGLSSRVLSVGKAVETGPGNALSADKPALLTQSPTAA